jgi:hypothetical protein
LKTKAVKPCANNLKHVMMDKEDIKAIDLRKKDVYYEIQEIKEFDQRMLHNLEVNIITHQNDSFDEGKNYSLENQNGEKLQLKASSRSEKVEKVND